MRTKLLVAALTAALLLYLVLVGVRGVLLVASGDPVGVALGIAVLVLPVVVLWTVVRELMFGRATEVMARELAEAGRLPPDDLPRTPSGRIQREAADAAFAGYRAEAEAQPEDWGAWFRLSCAYDASRDRKRARAAMRHASALHRVARAAG